MSEFPDIDANDSIDQLMQWAIEDPDPSRSMAALEKFISGTEPVEVRVLSQVAARGIHEPTRARAIERLKERGNEGTASYILQEALKDPTMIGELNAEQRAWAAEAIGQLGA
jgi:hypothetical protein